MTASELREAIEKLGWSQRELARRSGRDESRIRKMARGAEPVDQMLADWLIALVRAMTPPRRPHMSEDDA